MNKKKYPWEERSISYSEWGSMSFDWNNYHKVKNNVTNYFHFKRGYERGQTNEHIMKSTFGRKNESDIIKEIEWWFGRCVGAYSEITYICKN